MPTSQQIARRAPFPEAVAVPAAAPADPVAVPTPVVARAASLPVASAAPAASVVDQAVDGGAGAVAAPTRTPLPRARRARAEQTPPGGRAATGPVARRNGPARVAATVLLVPALVGTVALPAYAFLPGGHLPGGVPTKFSLSVAEAQDLDVSELASGAPVSSDTFSVTTKAEIDAAAAEAAEAERAAWEAELASRGTGEYAIVAQQAEGDDYPWWNETPDDYGGGSRRCATTTASASTSWPGG
ncbi:hypothetical protein GCM10025870_27980 [Agromyces marinus]|uniref:Uncharacterized protein n=1 Tax=Agromyces marinus TaxID=1389020 RepID=A0ABN6YHY4_9MICO|nr:hypothetical protein [Agromyces marinus]BDZ55725.1 hypothetical protein GCM10025870_27980 [Agromyces marinus]